MWTKYILLLVVFASALILAASSTVIEQDKLCSKTEVYNATVVVSEQKPERVREFVWCLAVPPRCSRSITKIKTVTRNEIARRTRSIAVCCKGYEETPDRKKCTPICSLGCSHGSCVAPETCVCSGLFEGPNCSLCPNGKWGENCENTCHCIEESSKCDASTGTCTDIHGKNKPISMITQTQTAEANRTADLDKFDLRKTNNLNRCPASPNVTFHVMETRRAIRELRVKVNVLMESLQEKAEGTQEEACSSTATATIADESVASMFNDRGNLNGTITIRDTVLIMYQDLRQIMRVLRMSSGKQ